METPIILMKKEIGPLAMPTAPLLEFSRHNVVWVVWQSGLGTWKVLDWQTNEYLIKIILLYMHACVRVCAFFIDVALSVDF